ncbi:SlyX protein [Actibacterium atlanticum]|uniref:SlyX protein n=1 Tax=Actibacterium atlanticum TaxID=1461693 RepID=A0A058ZMU0_9RHOB|nr:SlyX family protein [Actibacterium atlanticum]KCV82934.1 SlyX protein [Actibacterium atlanticum]
MSDDRLTKLETRVAELIATTEDLSDIVAQQADEIARLTNRVRMLKEREAERELTDGASVPLADQKPPHW